MFDLPDKPGTARLLLREDATHDRPLMVFQTKGDKWPDIDPIPNLPTISASADENSAGGGEE